jgi:uncharacterized protein YkwD
MPRRRAHLLVAAAVAALALAAPASAGASAATAACPGADLVPDGANLAQVGQATLCLLNDERAGAGLAPVAPAAGLTQPSLAYSAQMVARSFFAHVSPDGRSLTDRLAAAGYISAAADWTVGENLAWGQGPLATPRSVVLAWMASPGHRANVLTREFEEIGIGIVLGTPGDPSWGATYTTDYGTVRRAGGGSPARTAATSAPGAAAARPAARAATKAAGRATRRCRILRARAARAKGSRSARRRAAACGRAARARHARARARA